ncbi:EmrB/QacA subfamily drug resistance transporter [Arthrobacter pigmenti]|uniref:EmrB/QacA subfamily drug resistance transporter n=1 Tax=Arthrobacter pigmenti TaxID=271432 RepID=A0A846RSQ5_9MICC|nr:MDR family MFS transporter [Arthrobacter pigmenti]NJC21341.1 EmrB/QacA subfamily drug resistance transporter [Arthrobacter pigmenti]
MTSTATAQRKESGLLLLFVGLMLSMLLAALNQMILSTALPTIVGELSGVDQMLWVITAYILAATIVMPIYGKLGDLIGRKNLLLLAIVIFMAGSVVGGLAPNMEWLIAGRAFQGLGGGGLMILSQAIIADVVPARERGKYMGAMGGVFAFASVAGPLLGGWFTEGPGWRWMFWINMPLGVLAIVVVLFFLHLPARERSHPHIDVTGMVLLAIATTSIVLVGTWGGTEYEWLSIQILGLFVVAVGSAVLFVLAERRAKEPILPMSLFRERSFVLTTAGGLMIGVTMFGAIGYLPTYLQMVTGASATNAGLLMIPMMGALILTSTGSGVLVSKTGRYKWMPITGSLAVTVALLLLSTITPTTPVWIICVYIAIMGAGLGLSMQILVLIVQNTFPNRVVGTATASNNYFRQIGATLGSAIVGSLFTARVSELLLERLPAAGSALDGGANSLTPAVVNSLPDALQSPIIQSYNDALTPLFLYMAPLGVIAAILLSFVQEKELSTVIERDTKVERDAGIVPAEPAAR